MNGHPELWKLIRDSVLLIVGVYMLIHETRGQGRFEVMGAALVLVGLVPALRIDEILRR